MIRLRAGVPAGGGTFGVCSHQNGPMVEPWTPEEEIRKVLSRDAIAAAVTNQKVQRFLLDHAALTSVVEKE